MKDEDIEKALECCGTTRCEECPFFKQTDNCMRKSRLALDYINRLKFNLESAIQSFTKMETLYKVKCKELEIAEEKLQANLEKAYEHNEEECKRCMDKVEFKQQCEKNALKAQIRKETAKEILQILFDEAMRYGKTTDGIIHMAKKYGVEVGNEKEN